MHYTRAAAAAAYTHARDIILHHGPLQRVAREDEAGGPRQGLQRRQVGERIAIIDNTAVTKKKKRRAGENT